METKTETFIKLIDQASLITEELLKNEQVKQPELRTHLNNVNSTLESIRSKTLNGELEPSAGVSTLGLSRGVTDWIEPLNSPLVKAVGAIEEYYQKHL